MQCSQSANHTHDLLTQRIQLCCEILQSVNWKWGRTLSRDSTVLVLIRASPHTLDLFRQISILFFSNKGRFIFWKTCMH